MPINQSQYREIILDKIGIESPQSVYIETLYKAAEEQLRFDEHDLALTTVKGSNTNEPNWTRNLRNALQGFKDRGELANVAVGYWRLSAVNNERSLDPELAWQLIKDAAQKAFEDNATWESVRQHHSYIVEAIEKEKIIIRRMSTDTIEQLYKSDVIRGIKALNAAGGVLGRRSMIYVVAKEVAIVHFHPDLIWDDNFETFSIQSTALKKMVEVASTFEEAQNDDVNQFQKYARRIRKGQSKLRRILLMAYNNVCCISRTGPENVLQAAHIDAHATTGINVSTNALLLRSDLHDLFDDGLLLIDPYTLVVKIHPSLANTYYFKYNNELLMKRMDKLNPDVDRLKRKWENQYWG